MKWDRPSIIIFGLLTVVFLLYGFRLYIIVDRISEGVELGEMQDKIAKLNTQNLLIQKQYLELASFQNIATKAAQMGFTDCPKNCDFYVK